MSQYETEVPSVPTENKPPKKNNGVSEPDAEKSDNGGYNAPDSSETDEEGESSGGVGSGQGSGGSGDAKTGDDGGTGQGSPGNGSNVSDNVAVGEPTPVANSAQPSDDGGSSSPLVPILIAIAALAAISIGAVVIRQRRGSGGQVSPKAS